MPESLTIGTSSGNRDAAEIWIGTAAGNRRVVGGYIGTSSGNRLFTTSLAATVTPEVSFWTGVPSEDPKDEGAYLYYTSGTVTCTASGGTGPYSYAWVGTSPAFWTSASTNFTSFDGADEDVLCIVTDALGSSVYSNVCSIV